MRWRFSIEIGIALLMAVGIAARGSAPPYPEQSLCAAQAGAPLKEPAAPLIARVILLAPASPLLSDTTVQQILEYERAEREKAHRKPGSFTLRLPGIGGKSPSPGPAKTKPSPPAPPKGGITPPGENISTAQLRAITDTLLAEAFTARLRRLKIVVVPESEVQSALSTLKMSAAEAARPEGAEKLRAQLNGDAVITLSSVRVRVEEQQTRTLALWATVRIPALRTAQHIFPPLPASPEIPIASEPLAPQAGFAISGAATTAHAFLKPSFARTPASLASSATEEAAAIALHALRAGSVPAFPQEDAQVALLPVPSPTQADALLFAPEGRTLLAGAVRNLPANASERFHPEMLPLFPEAIRDTTVTEKAMRGLHFNFDMLWAKGQLPNRERIRALGRQLGVGYILMARITDIEVDTGALSQRVSTAPAEAFPPTPEITPPGQNGRPAPAPPKSLRLAPTPVPPWERQGRAEAIGMLVRVRDGVILWQGSAAATMNSRQVLTDKAQIQAANHQIAEDAARFALLQLQRQFRAYRMEATR